MVLFIVQLRKRGILKQKIVYVSKIVGTLYTLIAIIIILIIIILIIIILIFAYWLLITRGLGWWISLNTNSQISMCLHSSIKMTFRHSIPMNDSCIFFLYYYIYIYKNT